MIICLEWVTPDIAEETVPICSEFTLMMLRGPSVHSTGDQSQVGHMLGLLLVLQLVLLLLLLLFQTGWLQIWGVFQQAVPLGMYPLEMLLRRWGCIVYGVWSYVCRKPKGRPDAFQKSWSLGKICRGNWFISHLFCYFSSMFENCIPFLRSNLIPWQIFPALHQIYRNQEHPRPPPLPVSTEFPILAVSIPLFGTTHVPSIIFLALLGHFLCPDPG